MLECLHRGYRLVSKDLSFLIKDFVDYYVPSLSDTVTYLSWCVVLIPGVNFINAFFVQKFVQSQNVARKNAFVCKICAFNIDEIDH